MGYRFRLAFFVAAVIGCGCLAGLGHAQDKFPNKSIRLVVPFPPGFASDFLARATGQKLGEIYGQQIVIDNRPGAGGLIGTNIVAKALPDGYTLMMLGQAHLINTLIHKDPGYHPFNDFASVTEIGMMPSVIIVAPSLTVKSLSEMIAVLKAKPGQYNFASGGVGTWSHFSGELFKAAAGVSVVHVPFRVQADAITEMVAGRVHYYVCPLPAALVMLKAAKLKPLIIASDKRAAALPDVPTAAEAGLPFNVDNWFGIAAPAKTPNAVIAQLSSDIARALQEPDLKERFTNAGAEPAFGTPEDFVKLQQEEYERLVKLVKEMGINPN